MIQASNDTRARLLQTTNSLIDKVGLNGVTSTRVLSESGVSKSSLYHFFEDFDELINEAQVLQYKEIVASQCRNFREISSISNTSAEFFSSLESTLRECQQNEKQDFRFRRVSIIARSKNSVSIRDAVGHLQEDFIVVLTQAFELAQAKGFLVQTYSPRSIALTFQALLFGKIFDDVLLDSLDNEDWITLNLQVFKDAFLIDLI